MRSSPPAAARPGQLRRWWWLDRPVRVKGMIVVAAPLIAVTSASLAPRQNERQERGMALTASAVNSAAQ